MSERKAYPVSAIRLEASLLATRAFPCVSSLRSAVAGLAGGYGLGTLGRQGLQGLAMEQGIAWRQWSSV